MKLDGVLGGESSFSVDENVIREENDNTEGCRICNQAEADEFETEKEEVQMPKKSETENCLLEQTDDQLIQEEVLENQVVENDMEQISQEAEEMSENLPEIPDKVCIDSELKIQLEKVEEKLEQSTADVSGKLDNLVLNLQQIQQSLEAVSGYDQAVDTLKKSLNWNQDRTKKIEDELSLYKKDNQFMTLRPFLEFVVLIHMELVKSKNDYLNDREEFVDKNIEAYNEAMNLIKYYIDLVEGQMLTLGIEIVEYEPGSDFIAGEQMVSKTVLTDDSEQIGKVAEMVSGCYKYQDKILRKAKVQVYRKNTSVK